MNLHQAVQRSRIQLIIGFTLLTIGAIFYFVSLLRFAYTQALNMGSNPLLASFGKAVQTLVANIYNSTSPIIIPFWKHGPTLSQEDPLSYGNLLFVGLIGVMITGKELILASSRLRHRIKRQLEYIEEHQWRNNLQNNIARQSTKEQTNQIYTYQIPNNTDSDWWQRPWGAIGLSVISGYIVSVLAKITGMI